MKIQIKIKIGNIFRLQAQTIDGPVNTRVKVVDIAEVSECRKFPVVRLLERSGKLKKGHKLEVHPTELFPDS